MAIRLNLISEASRKKDAANIVELIKAKSGRLVHANIVEADIADAKFLIRVAIPNAHSWEREKAIGAIWGQALPDHLFGCPAAALHISIGQQARKLWANRKNLQFIHFAAHEEGCQILAAYEIAPEVAGYLKRLGWRPRQTIEGEMLVCELPWPGFKTERKSHV